MLGLLHTQAHRGDAADFQYQIAELQRRRRMLGDTHAKGRPQHPPPKPRPQVQTEIPRIERPLLSIPQNFPRSTRRGIHEKRLRPQLDRANRVCAVPRSDAPIDAVVLLGCRIEPDGQPCAAGLRRARAAANVFMDSAAKWLIASGGRRWHGHAEAIALAAALEKQGVPSRQIVTELCSLSTFENARYVAESFERLDVRRAAIVTCDWHLPRALRCFHCFDVDVVGIPAQSPKRGALRSFLRALRERVSFALDRTATLGLQTPPWQP